MTLLRRLFPMLFPAPEPIDFAAIADRGHWPVCTTRSRWLAGA